MPWFRKDDGEVRPGEKLEDVEFKPDKLKADLEESVSKKITEFSANTTKQLEPLMQFIADQQKEKKDKEAAELAAKNKKTAEDNEVDDTDFMLDPMGAINKKLAPTQAALINLASKQMRNEILGEKEYYHGSFKDKVDSMINGLPLGQRADAAVIDNCYKIVFANNYQDIQDGKIKARNNSASFESNGTGAPGAGKQEASETLTADEKFAAKALGISEKDWAKSRSEMSFV